MESTIKLFRHLYNDLPPLFPKSTKLKMKHAVHYLESGPPVSLEQIETIMIEYGYAAWPWREAFKEFMHDAEGRVAEHFLLPKLTPELQKRYEEFRLFGGTFSDLYSGRPADFFSGEERVDLSEALVETRMAVRLFAQHEVTGLLKKKYLARVEEFTKILAEMKAALAQLRAISERESDHPSLAQEMTAKIAAFEQSLCLLAPAEPYNAPQEAIAFFAGRRDELNRFRGINVPLALADWFNE